MGGVGGRRARWDSGTIHHALAYLRNRIREVEATEGGGADSE